MVYQRIHKSSSWNSPNQKKSSQFASRPFAIQAQQDSHRPPTQEEIENEAFDQNKFEAFGIQLKKARGAFTPGDQERLGVLQAKMNDFWAQRLERASQFGRNFANIPVHAPGNRISAPIQPCPTGDRLGASVEPVPSKTRLPAALKTGMEILSGYSLDNVRVHYNSPNPARLQALAYAQGTAIHVAPGQEEHLPHEAWHVVQQMQGRVKPTTQMNEKVKVNDDGGLEREADVMGAEASKSAPPQNTQSPGHQSFQVRNSQVVQRVKGGLEYTEDGGTTLYQWQPSTVMGLAPHNAAPAVENIAGSPVTFYVVPNGTYHLPADNEDHVALRAPTLRLENDVYSAEWIIEHHNQEHTKENFVRIIGIDWSSLWQKRNALSGAVNRHQQHNPGQQIIFQEGNHGGANLTEATADRVFEYTAQGAQGSVQITLGYKGPSAIQNIALSNVSRFLGGSTDLERVRRERVGGASTGTWLEDKLGITNQWVNANRLHSSLMADMTDVEPGLTRWGTIFSTSQLATVQLMVLMDTMARRATNDLGGGAQSSGKNIQSFFPKSARDSYVREMLGANYSDARMDEIRGRLNATIPASVAKFYAALDPLKLPVGAFREAYRLQHGGADEPHSQGIQHDIVTSTGATRTGHEDLFKDLILGAQIDFVATARNIIKAYTDTTGNSQEQRRNNNPVGPFEYMVSGKPPHIVPRDNGAVFEDRAEVRVTGGELGTWQDDNPLRAAIVSLLRGA